MHRTLWPPLFRNPIKLNQCPLKLYDLKAKPYPEEKESFRSVCIETENTFYLAAHLAEQIREHYPITAKITAICPDGVIYLDKGK